MGPGRTWEITTKDGLLMVGGAGCAELHTHTEVSLLTAW